MKNDEQLQQADLPIWLSHKIKFEWITTATAYRSSAIRLRDHEDYQDDDACPEGENNAKRVHDFHLGMESYQQKVNLTALTITFPSIEEYKVFDITSEPVCGIIYENSKGEKRVMVHKEIHKLCDVTLKRVLEKLKKYNKDVKYGYADYVLLMVMLNTCSTMKKILKIV
nr:hypothetical protein [Tanacetum cinerariifolium]